MAHMNETAMRASDWWASASAANATATATRAAPGAGRRHIITGLLFTVSGAPTAGGAITITGAKPLASDGPASTTLHTIVAGAAPSPIFVPIRIECDIAAAVSVALPALGAGITGTVTVFGATVGA